MEQLKISPQSLVGCQPDQSLSDLAQEAARSHLAMQRTTMLFGCYRKAEANDPEILTAAIAATLAEFAPEVIEYVTDPRTGLPATSKWLPSVFEVREACEKRAEQLATVKWLIDRGYVKQPDGRWKKKDAA